MGGHSQANYPAPVLAGLWQGENNAFAPVPFPNMGAAANNAFGGIGSLGATGANIGTAGSNLLPFVTQALQTGFDPQHALYNKSFQQQQDQTRAANAAAGVATTPYGAGMEASADQDFNIKWQNEQLARQQMGAGTAEGLLSGATGAQNINEQTIQNYLSYLRAGMDQASAWAAAVNNSMQVNNQLFGTQVSQQQAQNQAQSGALGGLGSLLGTLGGFGFAGGFG